MDLRVEKTRKNIINAFLELRAKKPLEKITVKELSEKAVINKSTFYAHYTDLYELSEELEQDVVDSILAGMEHSENILENPKLYTQQLFEAYAAKDSLIKILFSGSRSGNLIVKMEKGLRGLIFGIHPEWEENPVVRVIISYEIYGSYFAFKENRRYGYEQVVPVLGILSEEISKLYTNGFLEAEIAGTEGM